MWLTDRRGRQVGVPADKVAYVEIGTPDADRRIGFGLDSADRPASTCSTALLFVTGKGGVGKTTVAAGLALLAAERGKRTLVCEVDAKGSLAGSFEVGETGFEPREVQPSLFAMSMDTEESLKEYLKPPAEAARSSPASARSPAPSTSWPTRRPA